ncbi:uncharacterized protein LOC111331752 [Stylophora pistillata]|uniref:uncharacterized protein LOC111331752 n=1 Tax=Stylophora pistillata TaxID=50429 RepID=UPI000C04E28C|nr:uncharacterized protein LOC111331752 [Stylophora pistillata]
MSSSKASSGAPLQKRILVQGETGIGKTSFVKKMLVDLSNLDEANLDEEQKNAMRRFDLVLAVALKEVSQCQTFTEVLRGSRLFSSGDDKFFNDLNSYIIKNQERVLLVFDGYDEYRTRSKAEEQYGSRSDSPVSQIFHRIILSDCTVMVTTRTSRADELREPADIQAEVTGFNSSDRHDFMTKMLKSETEADELWWFLLWRGMADLLKVPLLNLFFCLLWREEKNELENGTKGKTKLYQAIVRFILQHSHRKHSPTQASMTKEESYEDILAEIGKVALEGLLRGDLVFEYDKLSAAVRGERSVLAGLLQVSECGPSVEPKGRVSFIHKSMQEYLAAWFITNRCVSKGNLGGMEEHAGTLKKCEELENVENCKRSFIEVFGCGDVVVKVTESATPITLRDFITEYFEVSQCGCSFESILGLHNGRFQFYVTEITLSCDHHAKLFTGRTASCAQSRSRDWSSEQSCLKFLNVLECDILSRDKSFQLFDKFCDLLQSVPNPNRCLLKVGRSRRDDEDRFEFEYAEYRLTTAEAEKLVRALPPFTRIERVALSVRNCSAAAAETLVTSVIRKTVKELDLHGITLTSAVAAALNRSLPQMSSLEELYLTEMDVSNLQAEEDEKDVVNMDVGLMEALFGGFEKASPVREFIFSGFSVRGCLAPFTKSLRFFPDLDGLSLTKLNLDEQDLKGLLESFEFIPRLSYLDLSCNPLGDPVRSIVPYVINLSHLQFLLIQETSSDEVVNYLTDAIRHARPDVLV